MSNGDGKCINWLTQILQKKQIRLLTQVLGVCGVKHQFMNIQNELVTLGKLWAVWNMKKDVPGFCLGFRIT